MDTLEQIKHILQTILGEHNAELVDITLSRTNNKAYLRILVDKQSGINIDECSRVNRELGDALDSDNAIQESYTLEVSSPGLDRPLKNRRDFEKIIGEQIDLFTRDSVEDKPFFQGTAEAVDDEGVSIKLKDSRTVKILFNNISKANLIIKMQGRSKL